MSLPWCTIESDPGVFTEMVEKFGTSGVEFAELYSLDDDDLATLAPVYGLIFLFKWTGETDARATLDYSGAPPGLFYAKQMVPNACATQAILSILLNVSDERVAVGQTLGELKSFATELPFDMRGLAIENSEAIRTAHNAFARPEPFISSDAGPSSGDEDLFHFVAYVPHAETGKVYELDGLKGGPIELGAFDASNSSSWLPVARAAITQRIEKYAASEIKFNLMAIVRDRRAVLDERLAEATQRAARAGADAAAQQRAAQDLADIEQQRCTETAKRSEWAAENVRRHHNYIPFAMELLKQLSTFGALPALAQNGAKRAQARPRQNKV